jgi:2-phosphosulfolactate phosphatase
VKFHRATLATCAQANGAVVVIDVLRAFTTATYAFAAGASGITLVGTVEEALALRARLPSALVMGEVGGLPPAGFDFGNSPSQFNGQDLTGRRLIQRTSAGIQGIVRSSRADLLLASSFVCARATAEYLRVHNTGEITFVITGVGSRERLDDGPITHGDEDAACANYLEALLQSFDPDPQPYLRRVWQSPPAQKFLDPTQHEFRLRDLQLCTTANCFDFALLVQRKDGLLVMQTVPPS